MIQQQKYTLMCHLMKHIYKNDSICSTAEELVVPMNGDESTEKDNYDSKNAAYYLIIVIGFYSLSIVFLLIFNSKFKIICKNRSCHCDNVYDEDDLYESQKKETKNTVKLIFNGEPKLNRQTSQNFSSQLLLPSSILYKKNSNDSAFHEDDDNSSLDKNSFLIESSL